MTALALQEPPVSRRRDVTINLRTSATDRDLIDRAATLVGKSRTEFVMDSARQTAEDVLLNQRLFLLDDTRYEEFLRLLDQPPQPVAALRKLMVSKSPWEK